MTCSRGRVRTAQFRPPLRLAVTYLGLCDSLAKGQSFEFSNLVTPLSWSPPSLAANAYNSTRGQAARLTVGAQLRRGLFMCVGSPTASMQRAVAVGQGH